MISLHPQFNINVSLSSDQDLAWRQWQKMLSRIAMILHDKYEQAGWRLAIGPTKPFRKQTAQNGVYEVTAAVYLTEISGKEASSGNHINGYQRDFY